VPTSQPRRHLTAHASRARSGRWRIFRGVLGALIFAGVYSLGLRLRITPGFEDIPNEVMLALPYIIVILALALSGRNVPYPGAYLKPYRRS
jgi:ABC-type uncharacterized transport system permease subunit